MVICLSRSVFYSPERNGERESVLLILYLLLDVCIREAFTEKCCFMEPWVTVQCGSSSRLGRFPRLLIALAAISTPLIAGTRVDLQAQVTHTVKAKMTEQS